jgi:hypothetical protein
MKKIEIIDAIVSLVPEACCTINGDQVYENIQWLSTGHPIPTEDEVLEETARLQAESDSKEYQRLRQKEYPPMSDYLDAVYWQSQGDDTKMTSYLAAVEAVKSKYPKGNS